MTEARKYMHCLVSVVGALQKEVAALEELSQQLFMEYVDMLGVRVSVVR